MGGTNCAFGLWKLDLNVVIPTGDGLRRVTLNHSTSAGKPHVVRQIQLGLECLGHSFCYCSYCARTSCRHSNVSFLLPLVGWSPYVRSAIECGVVYVAALSDNFAASHA